MNDAAMTPEAALVRLRQYRERPAPTWSTASYGGSSAEAALAEIGRVLADEVERLRAELAARPSHAEVPAAAPADPAVPHVCQQAERDRRIAQAQRAIEDALAASWRHWRRPGRRPDFGRAALAAVDSLGDLAVEILVDGTMLRSLTAKDGVLTLDLEPAKDIVRLFVAAMHGMLDGYGAENYLETEATVPATLSLDVRDGDFPDQAYTVTIQRRTRPTAHELRQAAEARLAAVLDECDAIDTDHHGQHDEDADGARDAVRRIRAAAQEGRQRTPQHAPQAAPVPEGTAVPTGRERRQARGTQ
ncbi:hypothetical protein [Streptomyces sp. CC224B]|uniref:hypothetical protein n=1 Tax=Streptomyces sp. CC224B TaxID=3044571 RepID=UPI0024A92B4E|nr:hypothetical protein [Streptomyces sp. CC224B]